MYKRKTGVNIMTSNFFSKGNAMESIAIDKIDKQCTELFNFPEENLYLTLKEIKSKYIAFSSFID